MSQRLTWQQITETYPDEWVALIEADESATQVHSGVVIAHAPGRKEFHELLKEIISEHPHLSISYTGPLVTESDTPLLWQISNMAR